MLGPSERQIEVEVTPIILIYEDFKIKTKPVIQSGQGTQGKNFAKRWSAGKKAFRIARRHNIIFYRNLNINIIRKKKLILIPCESRMSHA